MTDACEVCNRRGPTTAFRTRTAGLVDTLRVCWQCAGYSSLAELLIDREAEPAPLSEQQALDKLVSYVYWVYHRYTDLPVDDYYLLYTRAIASDRRFAGLDAELLIRKLPQALATAHARGRLLGEK